MAQPSRWGSSDARRGTYACVVSTVALHVSALPTVQKREDLPEAL